MTYLIYNIIYNPFSKQSWVVGWCRIAKIIRTRKGEQNIFLDFSIFLSGLFVKRFNPSISKKYTIKDKSLNCFAINRLKVTLMYLHHRDRLLPDPKDRVKFVLDFHFRVFQLFMFIIKTKFYLDEASILLN